MKTKHILAFFLALPIVVLLLWTVSLQHNLDSRRTVVVRMTGFDPRDILSGRYLLLRPDWQNTDCAQFKDNKCPAELFGSTYRYYLPEADAVHLDKEIWQNNMMKLDLVFSFQEKTKPMVKDLLIDGMPWKDWVAMQSAAQLQNP